jgi:hypothetical protein
VGEAGPARLGAWSYDGDMTGPSWQIDAPAPRGWRRVKA